MATAWEYLERLCRHPHRGTATDMEAAAAADLQQWLSDLGYTVTVQPFRTPRDTLYLGPAVVMLVFGAAALLGLRWPWAGLALALLVAIPMVGELLGSSRLDFDLLLPRYQSRNVVARQYPPGATRGTVVVTAHYDTQRASLLFHPAVVRWLQPYFTLVYGLLGLVPAMLVVEGLLPGAAWPARVLQVLAVLLLANILFLLTCRITGRYINGANDNGSGTALALALADRFAAHPPAGTELLFVLTGAEEVGTRGMKHFVKHAGLDPSRTCFVNLDNIGGGVLHYLQGEGMLRFQPYAQSLVTLADQVARELGGHVRPKRNLLLPTDGAVAASAGYEAISFLAFQEDGSLPNYHWYTDTLDRVDRELLTFAEGFLAEYVVRMAAAGGNATT